MNLLTGKTVLLTGGAGTVGRELIRHTLRRRPAGLRVVDSNESEVFNRNSRPGYFPTSLTAGTTPNMGRASLGKPVPPEDV